MKKFFLLVALAIFAVKANSQLQIQTESGDFKLKFAGRTNVDFATYLSDADNYDDDHKKHGIVINDTRLGVQASFCEKWSAKVEICYTNKAISFRDLWMGFDISKKHGFKIGNMFMPFGGKPLGLAYKFVEDAPADYAICSGRKIGFAYNYVSDFMNASVGVYSDGDVDSKATNNGFDAAGKIIIRPWFNEEEGHLLHLGVAPIYTHPKSDLSYKGIMPTTIETNNLISRTYEDAKNYLRLEVEAIFMLKKLYAEAHYLNVQVLNETLDNEKVHATYVQAGWMILGEKQNYNKTTGLAAAASPKSLEVLARYDHLNLHEGGQQNDVTVGINYFFNKYINVKANYIFAANKDKNGDNKLNHNLMQLRMQFSF